MWFPGDDLFTPSERRRGLPLGNQTSQFFANVYLDPLDHFVTDRLGLGYVRYVDDCAPRRCERTTSGDLFRRMPFQRATTKPSSPSGRDVQQSTGERPLGEP